MKKHHDPCLSSLHLPLPALLPPLTPRRQADSCSLPISSGRTPMPMCPPKPARTAAASTKQEANTFGVTAYNFRVIRNLFRFFQLFYDSL